MPDVERQYADHRAVPAGLDPPVEAVFTSDRAHVVLTSFGVQHDGILFTARLRADRSDPQDLRLWCDIPNPTSEGMLTISGVGDDGAQQPCHLQEGAWNRHDPGASGWLRLWIPLDLHEDRTSDVRVRVGWPHLGIEASQVVLPAASVADALARSVPSAG